MLKNFFFVVCLVSIISCKKTNDNNCTEPGFVAPAPEVTQLMGYIPNGAVKHPSGFYYIINVPGSNLKPTICSTVKVKYTGYLLPDNTIFESPFEPIQFVLGGLILGWQKGLPLIGEGGQIDLYLPPSFAYGAAGSGSIPPNAYLRFNIQLLDVQ